YAAKGTTSFWKPNCSLFRKDTRTAMVKFIQITNEKATTTKKNIILYGALLYIKNEIQTEKRRINFTSVLGCIVDELATKKSFYKTEDAKQALSDFWRDKEDLDEYQLTKDEKKWFRITITDLTIGQQ
ncbi:MAG: hypothetical protein KDH94_01155, partial [Coxiellaceae bacterium]|nr:hypothetical protein [Coxiellaceae bacterium]